jgi:hypothetical protein
MIILQLFDFNPEEAPRLVASNFARKRRAADDPVASDGIGRLEFLNDSNLNPLLGKTPLRIAHRASLHY